MKTNTHSSCCSRPVSPAPSPSIATGSRLIDIGMTWAVIQIAVPPTLAILLAPVALFDAIFLQSQISTWIADHFPVRDWQSFAVFTAVYLVPFAIAGIGFLLSKPEDGPTPKSNPLPFNAEP